MLQRPHFLPKVKPKLGGADGALREDHLVYGQIARGQPCDAKASERLSVFASVLQPLANPSCLRECKKAVARRPRARCVGAETHSVHTENGPSAGSLPGGLCPNRESSSQILMASPATSPAGDTTQQEAVQLACLALTKPGDAGAAASAAVLGAATLAFRRSNDQLKLGNVTIQRVYPAFDGADIINGDTMLHAAVRRQLHDVTSALLEAGAPLGVRNTNGETAFEVVTGAGTSRRTPSLSGRWPSRRRQADEDEAQLAAALAASALESTPRTKRRRRTPTTTSARPRGLEAGIDAATTPTEGLLRALVRAKASRRTTSTRPSRRRWLPRMKT